MADSDLIDELFDDAFAINEDIQELYRRRDGVRRSLRNLRDAGKLSEEQEKELKDLFPDIKRTRKKGNDNGTD